MSQASGSWPAVTFRGPDRPPSRRDGVDAAQSGAIVDGQSSVLSATVTGPVTVAFWWKVDSEQGFDFLDVSLDGAVVNRISGVVDWVEQTVAVPAGEHVVRWAYTKDGSVSGGRDAGWIDQVELRPAAPLVTLGDALDSPELQLVDGGVLPWTPQATTTRDGVDAAQSGRVANDQASSFSVTVTGPATVAFWWKVESEQNFDFLDVSLDGVLVNRISGAVDWVEQTVAVPAGEHVVRWAYTKDGSVSSGRDAGWIDQLVLPR